MLGGVAGLLVARWTLTLVASLLPPDATRTLQFELQGRIVAFAAALSIAPGNADAGLALARLLIEAGAPTQGIERARVAVERVPSLEVAWLEIGRAYSPNSDTVPLSLPFAGADSIAFTFSLSGRPDDHRGW